MEEQNQDKTAKESRPQLVFVIALFGVVLGPMMLASAISCHFIYLHSVATIKVRIAKSKHYLWGTEEQVKTPPPEKDSEGKENEDYRKYVKLVEIRKMYASNIVECRKKLERIRAAGYEVYFAVVIDSLLILGGIGLMRFRRWGHSLLLLAILLTPLYGIYYFWHLREMHDEVRWYYYLAYLAAIPLIWAFRYLLSKRVRGALR